jgi:hypothetical protein
VAGNDLSKCLEKLGELSLYWREARNAGDFGVQSHQIRMHRPIAVQGVATLLGQNAAKVGEESGRKRAQKIRDAV